MSLDSIQHEYDQGCRWRAAWLALAKTPEPNRLQAKQERIERRAVLANGRVGRAMRAADTARTSMDVSQKSMSSELAGAIKTILGTLQPGAELRFYWHDGAQHLRISSPGQPDQVARLNSAAEGIGVVLPVSVH